MAERHNYIVCIGCSREPRKSWCGRALPIGEFRFVGIEHAAENGAQKGRLVACPECAAAVMKALAHGVKEDGRD